MTLAPIIALGALTPTPSFTPLSLLLVALRLHVFTAVPRRQWKAIVSQVGLISLAVAATHSGASLHALSTPAVSLVVLAGLAVVTTSIAGLAIVIGFYAERRARTTWSHATVFPATWATVWAAVEYCSPVGQLATWSPVVGLEGYAWLREFGGQVALNWVVAAWAVVIADAVGAWVVGAGDGDEVSPPVAAEVPPPLIMFADDDGPVDGALPKPSPRASTSAKNRTRATLLFTAVLLALAVPSYFISDTPLPVLSPDVTPLGVACALPYPQRNGKLTHPPGLDDYVKESKTLQSQAKIVLWPESAVHFDSEDDRAKAFRRIQPQIANGTYYGIGFEETIHHESPDGVWKSGMKRNGFALLGWEGVVYEYYKRHLVPSKSSSVRGRTTMSNAILASAQSPSLSP